MVERLGKTTQPLQSGVAVAVGSDEPPAYRRHDAASASEAAKRFLLQVMNDNSVALALRLEAAKALLRPSNDDPLGPPRQNL